MRILLSIWLTAAVITSSAGYTVIHHHCLWCGGDRIEWTGIPESGSGDHGCCQDHGMNTGHDCEHDSCCQPGILKIDQAVSSQDNLPVIKACSRSLAQPAFPVIMAGFFQDYSFGLETIITKPPSLAFCQIQSSLVVFRC